ncbi:MAG: polyprenyl synthetase family protein [Candidatus Omnitrophica bacterium]|nr:polyprenyl synthetase family protein [Candidatus Omnitrophota bacterium]MCM8808659.1 polyprenyl synthetase family protein [Candidatus Omnitrophota bacterium]MCM8810426.1 polyprenyl synthetase family protein [Candidatus Omnitrophota bacterium]
MENKIKIWKEEIEDYLDKKLPKDKESPEILSEAIRYVVFSKGKRLRPILVLCVSEIFEINRKKILPVAGGIELIHNFSLVHDDLPSMDNDDYRRGLPTCHKKFGEGIAILVGDTLLTYGFQLIAESGNLILLRDIAKVIGHKGMAGGQVLDLIYKGKKINEKEKRKIDYLKTGKLFEICFKVPFYFKEIEKEKKELIEKIAKNFGIAFQIRDDIEDREGDINKLRLKLKDIYNKLKIETLKLGEKGKVLLYIFDKIYADFL